MKAYVTFKTESSVLEINLKSYIVLFIKTIFNT